MKITDIRTYLFQGTLEDRAFGWSQRVTNSRQAAIFAGLGLDASQSVEDWQQVAADSPLFSLAPIMMRYRIRSSLTDAIMADSERRRPTCS